MQNADAIEDGMRLEYGDQWRKESTGMSTQTIIIIIITSFV
jgi:hypothetical protein